MVIIHSKASHGENKSPKKRERLAPLHISLVSQPFQSIMCLCCCCLLNRIRIGIQPSLVVISLLLSFFLSLMSIDGYIDGDSWSPPISKVKGHPWPRKRATVIIWISDRHVDDDDDDDGEPDSNHQSNCVCLIMMMMGRAIKFFSHSSFFLLLLVAIESESEMNWMWLKFEMVDSR